MRLVILFDNFGPYHLARLAAAHNLGRQQGLEVMGMEIVGRSSDYAWGPSRHEISKNIMTLFPMARNSHPNPSAPRRFLRVWQALRHLEPDALAIPGYQGAVSLAALLWGEAGQKTLVMMSESSQNDRIRRPFVEWCKSQMVRRFDAALVGGTRQREYAALLGIPQHRIFLGYDVVDNDYFAREVEKVRQDETHYRQVLGLPPRYFLAVSRFIPKKNLSGLIQAYAAYRQLAAGQAWDLVLCGSGPLEQVLKNQARDIPGIHFPGFTQIDKLPCYYGLASTFILPSTSFEQWGLVVNEAMASGLPVLVSKVCGCVPNLVRNGVNGFTFDPDNLKDLAYCMAKMTFTEVDLKAMGEASRQIITAWTPKTFAENLIRAVKGGN